jgi:hypothetical protein
MANLKRIQGTGGSGYSIIQEDGTPFPPETIINFTGAGVTVTDNPGGGSTTVNIPGGSAGAYYQTMQAQGSALPQETILNFSSDSFTLVDDPTNDRTNVFVSGVISWDVVTVNTQMAVQMGYIPNSASQITFTLPATAVPGDTIRIVGYGTGLWSIAQNAGQSVRFGEINTTTGTGGSITSTNQGDAIEVICVVANTLFVVGSATGTLSII